jgi:hypothetical protein
MTIQIDIATFLFENAKMHIKLAKSFQSKKNDEMKEAHECIQTIILFQTGMEAFINEEIESERKLLPVKKEQDDLASKYKTLSFKNKWEQAFDALKIKKREPLQKYLAFYSSYRILISHPKSRYISLENYEYEKVYDGIKSGWESMQLLFEALGKTMKSWNEFYKK